MRAPALDSWLSVAAERVAASASARPCVAICAGVVLVASETSATAPPSQCLHGAVDERELGAVQLVGDRGARFARRRQLLVAHELHFGKVRVAGRQAGLGHALGAQLDHGAGGQQHLAAS